MDVVRPKGNSIETGEPVDVHLARALILQHGWNSTSFQIVNPGIKRWFRGSDAVVGFMSSAGFRIVVGAPVCPKEDLPDVVGEFEDDAARCSQSVCYFGAETRLESLLEGDEGHSKFLIGAQPAWNPTEWPGIVAGHRSYRAQLNRARNKGVFVTEWPFEQAIDNSDLRGCLDEWLESKHLPPLHFMVEPDTLGRLEDRRVFVAERNGRAVGFVVLSPIASRKGWLFEQFPHRPDAPNGTVELMVHTAMTVLADSGCDYATLGLSPLSRRADVSPSGDPLWLRVTLAWLRKHGQRFYNFDGLDAFKAKLRPTAWEPVFAISNEPRITPRTLYAIASVFSGNAPFKLAAGALVKAVRTELRWLGSKLIA